MVRLTSGNSTSLGISMKASATCALSLPEPTAEPGRGGIMGRMTAEAVEGVAKSASGASKT